MIIFSDKSVILTFVTCFLIKTGIQRPELWTQYDISTFWFPFFCFKIIGVWQDSYELSHFQCEKTKNNCDLVINATIMALFDDIKGVFDSVLAVNELKIDNWVTKLHYRVTTIILVCYSGYLSLNQVSVDGS